MNHRHLQLEPGTPAEKLPSAAIVDVLARGDLDDWQPIARAIRRDPTGGFADRVLLLLDAYPQYGTSPLWRAWIDRCRARAQSAPPGTAAGLSDLRRQLGLTQAQLAQRLETTQSDLSKRERRQDMRLSSLGRYAEGLGGRLSILFLLEGRQIEVRLPAPPAGAPGRRR